MDQLLESNLLNLSAVWIGLFFILKNPIVEALETYKSNEKAQRARLESLFFKSQQSFHKNLELKNNSSNFKDSLNGQQLQGFIGPKINPLIQKDLLLFNLFKTY